MSLVLEQHADCDSYVGPAEALIAAGVLQRWQLPGEPGNGAYAATFHADGSRARRGDPRSLLGKCGRLQVRRIARGCLRVDIWLGEEARDARCREHLARLHEQRELARSWPFPVVHGTLPQ